MCMYSTWRVRKATMSQRISYGNVQLRYYIIVAFRSFFFVRIVALNANTFHLKSHYLKIALISNIIISTENYYYVFQSRDD